MRTKPRPHVRWFTDRQWPERRNGKPRRRSPRQLVALRLHDFARLFRSRYGVELPDDDAGRDDLDPVIHHIASQPQAAKRARLWLDLWAPWLTLGEQRKIIADGIASARAWTADQLAWRYRLTMEERTMLGITTIGAVDQGKAARAKLRKERDRQRKANARRAAGAKPRREYEAGALAQLRPWEAAGMSRRTWYRKRGTGPATA